jgi:hypothetical protein
LRSLRKSELKLDDKGFNSLLDEKWEKFEYF